MSEYLYKIEPARVEMLSEGPTPEDAAIIAQHFDYLSSSLFFITFLPTLPLVSPHVSG